jgi:hypothetical protein
MRDMVAGLAGSEGLIDAHVAEASDGSCLAGVTQWESAVHFERALPTILASLHAAIPLGRPSRTTQFGCSVSSNCCVAQTRRPPSV